MSLSADMSSHVSSASGCDPRQRFMIPTRILDSVLTGAPRLCVPMVVWRQWTFLWQALANITPGYSGADLSNLCQEAALMAARQDLHGASHVAAEHFKAALLHLQPSVRQTSGHSGMTLLDSCGGVK